MAPFSTLMPHLLAEFLVFVLADLLTPLLDDASHAYCLRFFASFGKKPAHYNKRPATRKAESDCSAGVPRNHMVPDQSVGASAADAPYSGQTHRLARWLAQGSAPTAPYAQSPLDSAVWSPGFLPVSGWIGGASARPVGQFDPRDAPRKALGPN